MSFPRVVLAGFYPPPFAGEPIHVKQLARFLRERGLEVEILNLNRHAAPSSEFVTAPTPGGLIRLLVTRPSRSSILHLHTNGHNWKSWLMILTAALASRVKGTRTLLTIHSGLFPGYLSRFGRTARPLARWILRSFVRIIGVNEEIGQALERLGIRPGGFAVIPAFLGVSQVGGLEGADRSLVDDRWPLLVTVGGGDRDPELGLPVVVEILPDLVRLFPQLRAVFVGWQVGPKIRPLIEARNLAGHAICLGEISHERCLRFLQEADVVVRSTFADGDAITIREALDLGVPVIASDTAFRPAGVVLFRKGDAQDLLGKLRQVLSAPEVGRRHASNAGRPAEDLWRIYSDLVDPDPPVLSGAPVTRS
jgi:glycosyltransferase involved in cell wall biosynthesis